MKKTIKVLKSKLPHVAIGQPVVFEEENYTVVGECGVWPVRCWVLESVLDAPEPQPEPTPVIEESEEREEDDASFATPTFSPLACQSRAHSVVAARCAQACPETGARLPSGTEPTVRRGRCACSA